jgi:hypothetical protein
MFGRTKQLNESLTSVLNKTEGFASVLDHVVRLVTIQEERITLQNKMIDNLHSQIQILSESVRTLKQLAEKDHAEKASQKPAIESVQLYE